jgi:hypothetical protein
LVETGYGRNPLRIVRKLALTDPVSAFTDDLHKIVVGMKITTDAQ